nr:NADH dehydrogenase subunit 3 [Stenopsocus immaculatus]
MINYIYFIMFNNYFFNRKYFNIIVYVNFKKIFIWSSKSFSFWMWVWPKIIFAATFFNTIFFNYNYFFNFRRSNCFTFTNSSYLFESSFIELINIKYFIYYNFIDWCNSWMESSHTWVV